MSEARAKLTYDESAIAQWCAERGMDVQVERQIGDGALNLHWLLTCKNTGNWLVFRVRGEGHWLQRGFVGEGLALALARQVGLSVPRVRLAHRDSMVMDFVEGSADREGVIALAAVSEDFCDQVCSQLRALREQTRQSFGREGNPTAWLKGVIERYCLADTPWVDQLENPQRVRAIMESALDHGFEHLCLNHGDFRTGNLLVNDRGLSAVLDWEFAAYRPIEADVGWMLSSPWRYSRPDLSASGLMHREALLSAVGQADDPRLWAWEALALVRWVVIARLQDARQGLKPGSNADERALIDEAEAILRR